jgi:hypothetical protein
MTLKNDSGRQRTALIRGAGVTSQLVSQGIFKWDGGEIWDSSFRIAADTEMDFLGSDSKGLYNSTLVNNGSANWIEPSTLLVGKQVTILNYGTFNLQCDGNIKHDDADTGTQEYLRQFINVGLFTKTGGDGGSLIDLNLKNQAGGDVEVDGRSLTFLNFTQTGNNSLTVTDGGSITIEPTVDPNSPHAFTISSGTLLASGGGTISVPPPAGSQTPGSVYIYGTLEFAGNFATLNINAQLWETDTTTVFMRIGMVNGAPQSDRINVSDIAYFGGLLAVRFFGDDSVSNGTQFTLYTYKTLGIGGGPQYDLPSLPDGYQWQPDSPSNPRLGPNSLVIAVISS